MKKRFIILFFAAIWSLVINAQHIHTDTAKARPTATPHGAGKGPSIILPTFIEAQVYTPGLGNKFNMAYKFSAGGMAMFNFAKKLTAVAGIRLWQNAAESYALASRSWVQSGFHGAAGLLYNVKLKKSNFMFGPAVGKFSYILSGIPEFHDNEQFHLLKKTVMDSVPGIRGDYYTGLYLFLLWQKRTQKSATELEFNILIPGKLPEAVASWQPRGSLIHALRVKASHERKKISIRGDIQIPILSDDKSTRYSKLMPSQTTCKIEGGYTLSTLNTAKIKAVVGYERDWHALNFPSLLKESGLNGTWGAAYIGIRIESLAMKMKK